MIFEKNISKKALSDGILANPRPLYNRNVAKVSIVKWPYNWIFVDGNPFFGLTYDFKLALKTAIFQKMGMPEMTLLATEIQFRDHFTIDTFGILLL